MNSSVKKLAIVPFEVLQDLNNNFSNISANPNYQNLLIKPELKELGNLDQELKIVLNSNEYAPDIKYGKYLELLNKYAVAMKNLLKPSQIEVNVKEIEKVPQIENIQTNENYESIENIIKAAKFPNKNIENKSKTLLEHLKTNENIKWDQSGEIIYKNQKIPSSNMINTIQDLMRNRKMMRHPGLNEVLTELEETNFPKGEIVNKNLFPSNLNQRDNSASPFLGNKNRSSQRFHTTESFKTPSSNLFSQNSYQGSPGRTNSARTFFNRDSTYQERNNW